MRVFGLTGVIAGLLVASAAGQEAVEFKVAYPKAGERGKVTAVEKKGDKYGFTVDGKAVEGDALNVLEAEFNKPSTKEDPRELMLPKGAVKPGDGWKLNTDALGKELGDNKDLQLDTAKLTGAGK